MAVCMDWMGGLDGCMGWIRLVENRLNGWKMD